MSSSPNTSDARKNINSAHPNLITTNGDGSIAVMVQSIETREVNLVSEPISSPETKKPLTTNVNLLLETIVTAKKTYTKFKT